MEQILKKLDQNILYVKSWQPFDFQNMGQQAIELKFTSGDTQMLTTPIDPARGNDRGDFKDEAELMEFAEYLTKRGIPRT